MLHVELEALLGKPRHLLQVCPIEQLGRQAIGPLFVTVSDKGVIPCTEGGKHLQQTAVSLLTA